MYVTATFVLIMIAVLFSNSNVFSGITSPKGWEEEVYVDTNPEPVPKKIDIRSGFIPFTRNYMDPVHMHYRPQQFEITDIFHVTLAKNEFEPLIVGLYATRDVDNIRLELSGLRSDNDELKQEQIEIRKIEMRAVLPKGNRGDKKKYRLIPSILRLTNSTQLIKGQTAAFWITVSSSKDSTAGDYFGELLIKTDEKIIRTFKMHVTILPFALEEIPDKSFALLYTPTNLPPEMEGNARVLLRDMRAHGMTAYSPIASAWGEPLAFDESGRPEIKRLVHHLQMAKEEGFYQPSIVNINKLIRTGRPRNDANYRKFDEDIDIPNLKKLVMFLEGKRKDNNWPEIIYLPIDEPGCHTDKAGTRREEIAVQVLRILHDLNVPGATTVADLVDNKHRRIPRWKNVAGWWEKMRPYCSVRIYANGYPEGKTSLVHEMKDAELRGHSVMLYENSAVMGTSPCVSRMYFGFYGWKTGVSGITAWTHPTLGNAMIHNVWIDRKQRKRDTESYFTDRNWKLPPSTVSWEMVREGIDDAKYMYLFQKMLRGRSKIDNKYKKLTEDIRNAVNSAGMSQKKPECNLSGQKFSNFRRALSLSIMEMKASAY